MAVTDAAIRTAKPKEKPYRLYDAQGLYLEVSPRGGKWWRFKYRYGGKEKRVSLGVYPEVPLTGRKDKATGRWIDGAREKRDQARQLLAVGIDPGEQRKAMKYATAEGAANSVEVVAREWLEKLGSRWAKSHAAKTKRALERDVFPWLGTTPIALVSAPQLLTVLRRVEGRGAVDTAHRLGHVCGQIFRYAIATGRAERNPAADLRGALSPIQRSHFAAITDPKAAGPLLRALDGYHGTLATKAALRLAPLVFIRPGELRQAEWAEFDLDDALWVIPGHRMKGDHKRKDIPHAVPLSKQAISILREIHPLTGRGRYVFPNIRSSKRPMSDNTVNAALRRMGITKEEMTGHGFRAMARTILDEVLKVRPDIIEHQLAHNVRDPLGRAYNRTTYLPERRQMMQRWADYLDGLRKDTRSGSPDAATEAA
jgi:integrase